MLTPKSQFILVMLIIVALDIILIVKDEITYRKRRKIIDAIHEYHNNCFVFNEKERVGYGDLHNYYAAVFRFWNWSYTSIIKKDKLKIIKPYIQ